MRNLKLTVTYDGTEFCGWQTQPNGRTVQATLEAAIQSITQEPRIFCNASGRTDSGVHALGQVVNFFTDTVIPFPALVKAINSKLTEDVAVLDCEEVPQSFCAIRSAVSKRYRYVINDRRIPDPFLRRTSWQPRRILNPEPMHRAAQVLLGRHDFRCFETHFPNRLSSVRTIKDIVVERHGETIVIEVEADGFLYNMVRSITGTLYQIGRGYWPESKMREVLEGMDRQEAGQTAPPQGLFLVVVRYA